jgi:hypothetical protein
MTKSLLDDPEHWRKRALETTAKAEMSWRPEIKERLLKVAKEYGNRTRAEVKCEPPKSPSVAEDRLEVEPSAEPFGRQLATPLRNTEPYA